jgi:hypothetical protein
VTAGAAAEAGTSEEAGADDGAVAAGAVAAVAVEPAAGEADGAAAGASPFFGIWNARDFGCTFSAFAGAFGKRNDVFFSAASAEKKTRTAAKIANLCTIRPAGEPGASSSRRRLPASA